MYGVSGLKAILGMEPSKTSVSPGRTVTLHILVDPELVGTAVDERPAPHGPLFPRCEEPCPDEGLIVAPDKFKVGVDKSHGGDTLWSGTKVTERAREATSRGGTQNTRKETQTGVSAPFHVLRARNLPSRCPHGAKPSGGGFCEPQGGADPKGWGV